MAILLGMLWLIAGIAIGGIGWRGANGRLPRQHWAGIRLKSTMKSDATWRAAHVAGGPVLAVAGGIAVGGGLALLVVRPNDAIASAVSIALAALLLAGVLLSGVLGARAARSVTRPMAVHDLPTGSI